jgi:hypothetical protein
MSAFVFVNALNIEVEIFIFQFKSKQQEGYGKVSKLDELRKADVAKSSSNPQNKLHQF